MITWDGFRRLHNGQPDGEHHRPVVTEFGEYKQLSFFRYSCHFLLFGFVAHSNVIVECTRPAFDCKTRFKSALG